MSILHLLALLVAGSIVLQLALRPRRTEVDWSPLERGTTELTRLMARGEIAAGEAARIARAEQGQAARELRVELQERMDAGRSATEERLRAQASLLESQAKETRSELGGAMKSTGDTLVLTLSASGESQRKQLEALSSQLARALLLASDVQSKQLEAFAARLAQLTDSSEKRIDALRVSVEERLRTLQEDNGKQLEKMRATVDEKLQGTLEKRLSESFKQVSDRLEAVHKGLGEMQTLATGVGDLKKVLTNVKTRGTWGEVQLSAMLEQVLAPDQYASNVDTRGSGERVEFAIKLPAAGDDLDKPLYLPIDAKFPMEDYQRLVEASEVGDLALAEAASKQLEVRVKACAAEIAKKYIEAPHTTDFGVLYLPIEGLFAEVARRPGLLDEIQRKHHVVVAGPTTLWSILNSFQMGFRTLTIQKRSSDVWQLLGAVKTEFSHYGDLIGKVKKKLIEATNTMGKVEVRSRAIGRRLRHVEELPSTSVGALLPFEPREIDLDEADESDERLLEAEGM